ncbi:polyketide synthase-like protein [Penicillium brevicompactum]|uniref:Polyketide synthase-like protein n=1 Tax=Penicillium brevicompactum TaxID=5074 RepID=A0A9W9Q6K7_PENBR|nr:polyketide synthase-like protein [Penicillium brevicompactum]
MTISDLAPGPRPLAIVGMSCRFPGDVASLDDFWELLTNAKDGYREFPNERFNWEAFYHPNESRKDSIHVSHGYFLNDDVANFDASFFKMNATDATSFDPQGRILLECVYEALEDAGIPKESIAGKKVGVFSSSNASDYTLELKESVSDVPAQVGVLGHSCMLSNVVSNVFDLSGPSVSVDTACSSAFYALQMAAQSIRSGETDMCIVSGCALNLSPWRWNMLSNLTMLNSDGKTRALDPETESGYARGEGAACIILKSLDLALRDNDRVHCVLSHIGVNHNGNTNGYTMPDAVMQARLMTELQQALDVRPDEFGFVEAHAPGTRVGDPIEISAIQMAFSTDTRTPEEPLLLGSVKANVGHLESASGFPSLIKAALMLKKGQVVPNPNFKDEGMNSELRKLNMAVPTNTQTWPKGKSYVAINNYGFGGSNAHCIVKMAPGTDIPRQQSTSAEEPYLFVLSAHDEQALARTRERLVGFLEADDSVNFDMSDLAYTLGQRRSQLAWRSALVATELDDLALSTAAPRVAQRRAVRPPRIVFAFTGQGAQGFGMGRELLQYPVFAESLEQASSCVQSFGATFSLQEELFASEATSRINDADVSQAASTAIQIALVDLLRSWGVEPAAVVGHSSGEVAAAYAGGILSLRGAMRIAYARGQMAIRIKTVQPDFKGGMMAVSGGMEDVAPLLDIVISGTVVVACENSPKSLTVSGDDAALDELETLLEEDGIPHKRLAVDFPYHSPFLEPFIDQYEEDICTDDTFVRTEMNNVEFFSAMAGRKVDPIAVKKPSYWASSAKFRVRFTSAVNALLKSKTPPEVVIEIGPNPTLTWAMKSILKALGKQAPASVDTIPSLHHGECARAAMLKLAGSLFCLGQGLDMDQVNFGHIKDHGSRPRLIDGLKPYPWSRSRYWIDSKVRDDKLLRPFPRHDLLGHATAHSRGAEMAWSNKFEVEDMPWLRDHQVGSLIAFPLAGYVCAAVEASKQRAIISHNGESALAGFTVRDVRVKHHLVFQEGVRIELSVKLRPVEGSEFDEFKLLTWDEEQRAGKTAAEVVVSDTEAGMPHQYETAYAIHPTTLDGLLQCGSYIPFLGPSFAPIGATSNIWVPNAVGEVVIGSGIPIEPGVVLHAVARSEQPPQKLGGTYAIDAALKSCSDSKVRIRGLGFDVERGILPRWPAPHYGCYKVEWQSAGPPVKDATRWHLLQALGDESDLGGILSRKFDIAVSPLSQGLPAEAKFCIVLDIGEGLLGSVDQASFDHVKHALTSCEAVIWVTRGAFHHAANPTAGMAVGLLRTIRSEMQVPVATLDLDPSTASDAVTQAALVEHVAGSIANAARKVDANAEMEFTEINSQLFVSRIVRDEALDSITHAATGIASPQDEAFDPESRLIFGLQRPGDADTLFLQRADTVPLLAEEEVEIQVAAIGLGIEDVQSLQGRECSGTVVRCGEKTTRMQVGDRVFGLADTKGAFGTFVRAHQSNFAVVPTYMALEIAAALPSTFGAAQLALSEVARVREGETVVVLAAESAVGQAAVQIAKAIGANVHAVIDSTSGHEALLTVRPPADHIVDSLDAVLSAEVVLNPTHWSRCNTSVSRVLAPLGRFVQIGELIAGSTPRLNTGCSVAGALLSSVADSAPSRVAAVLDTVASYFAGDIVSGFSSIQTVRLDHLSAVLPTVAPSDQLRKVLVPVKGEVLQTTPAQPPSLALDSEAVYLLVGGGGGLGRVIARWMVDNGARKIGLLSRSNSMSSEVHVLAKDMAALGAEIFLLPCDVTDKLQLQQVVDQCATERGTIRGVINAAMVFKGGVFSSVSHADFQAVVRPKVHGTWNLHHALSNAPLEFFVLISSVAGLVGTPGHSAYAAANTFLDSFAKYRIQQGLPATSLALTAVVDAGYMAENAEKLQKLKYIDDYEGEILTTQDVLALLSASVSGTTATSCDGFCITGAGFGAARKLPTYAKDPRFSSLVSRHANEREVNLRSIPLSSDHSLSTVLDQSDSNPDVFPTILNAVRNKVAELQLIPVSDILDNQTIVDLALDSLTAMEVYSWIGRIFRVKFKVQEYAKLDTLEKIVESVISKREAMNAST